MQRGSHEGIRRRVLWHVLAGPGRLRQRRARGRVSRCGHRPAWGFAGLRPDGADDGLCHRPHLGLPPQPRCFGGPVAGRAVSGSQAGALHRGAGAGRHRRRRGVVSDRQRRARLRREQGLRFQRLRDPFSRGLHARSGGADRGRDDGVLPDRDSRRNGSPRPGRLCAHRHRPGADLDPPDQHPRHQHLGEPGAQHRRGAVCRRLGGGAAVAVLAGADRRRCAHAVS